MASEIRFQRTTATEKVAKRSFHAAKASSTPGCSFKEKRMKVQFFKKRASILSF